MIHSHKLRGFTLIEIIVVIAVIGILAGILVPTMIGYIRDSRYRTANSNAKTIYTVASGYCAQYRENSEGKDELCDWNGDGVINNWGGGIVKNIGDAIDENMGSDAEGSYYYVGISNEMVKFAMWSSENPERGSEIIGYYPGSNDPDKPNAVWGDDPN